MWGWLTCNVEILASIQQVLAQLRRQGCEQTAVEQPRQRGVQDQL